MPQAEKRIPIQTDTDIVDARQMARRMAETAGFSGTDLVVIATAVSEVARNIVEYANGGEIVFRTTLDSGRRGLIVIARDSGPGIADLALAMQEGYSTSRGLGMGLPGARRLMDEFDITSKAGQGTIVTLKKWLR